MPTANAAVHYIQGNEARFHLSWLNRGRVSENWKLKIFAHQSTGRQLAVYKRDSILVLVEAKVDATHGVRIRQNPPRSYAATIAGSHFAEKSGYVYDVDSLGSLDQLICKYLSLPPPTASLSTLAAEFDRSVDAAYDLPPEDRASRLPPKGHLPRRIDVVVSMFIRDSYVVAEVLKNARGECGACLKRAPFNRRRDGRPYLEVHHKIPLADGGEDTVANAIALCPNCHREAHHGALDLKAV